MNSISQVVSDYSVRAMHFVRSLGRPADTSTADGRAAERHRRIALSALAAGAAKVVSILTLLISVPITVSYLGSERYGLWMTMSSIVGLVGFADLGIGNGLLNGISEANGKGNRRLAAAYVSSALLVLTLIATILGVAFITIYNSLSWKGIYNLSSHTAVVEAGPATAVFILCFLLNIPLGTVQKIQLGYQEGFANSLWQMLGNLLSLGALLVVTKLQLGLPWLVVALSGAPLIATAANGTFLFGVQRRWLLPRLHLVTKAAIEKILRLGLLFFVLQFAVAATYASDNFVLTQILGPEAVTQYSIPARLFAVVPMIVAMVLNPLWPAYGESVARGDPSWAKRTLIRSSEASFVLTAIPALILLFLTNPILKIWVGGIVQASFILLLGLALWMVISTVGNAFAMFLNGTGVVGFQVVTASVTALISLLLKVGLTRTFGVPGVVWATILTYSLFTLLPTLLYLPRCLARIAPGHKLETAEG